MEDLWSLSGDDVEAKFAVIRKENEELYPIIGAFLRWFGEIEHQIDRLNCHLMGMKDNFELYGFLAQKLSHKRKCEAFREYMKRRGDARGKIGPNLDQRLAWYETDCIKKRNQIVHSKLEVRSRRLYFASPYQSIAPADVRPGRIVPQSVSFDDLMRVVIWMKEFFEDLAALAEQTWYQGLPAIFEIASPRSGQLGTANRKARNRRGSGPAIRRRRIKRPA